MKFSNGCWLLPEGYACFSPAEVYFSKIEKDMVTICAPTEKIMQRGDTLGGVNLTIQITAPYPEVLRIQTFHHMGLKKRTPDFELTESTGSSLTAEENETQLIIHSGSLRMDRARKPLYTIQRTKK